MPKVIDLKGQHFGNLTVLEKSDVIIAGVKSWKCVCDCGNITYARTSSLKSGNKVSCGCQSNKNTNLVGQKFYSLTVIKKSDVKRGNTFCWECLCDCGNITYARSVELTQGIKKSCGCLKSKKNDLTGKQFGKLTVLGVSDERLSNVKTWKCKCECGEIILARTGDLTSGAKTSCGCSNPFRYNLIGEKFYSLKVIEEYGRTDDNSIIWKCVCDCGVETTATTYELRSGHKKSCGCLKHEPKAKDLKGIHFGMLKLFKRVGTKDGRALWRCKCDCGKFVNVRSMDLLSGNTQSCGCLGREYAKRNLKKGGYWYEW